MKSIGILLAVGAIGLLTLLAAACSNDDEASASGAPGGGLVPRDMFLTYDGQRYELVNLLTESMAPESQFKEIGQASEADVDLKGDLRVFAREGDNTSVFTYSAATADDGAMWLAWRAVN